ncbi:hypothetical protein DYB36_010970, partial [Aphanomyces astaci]
VHFLSSGADDTRALAVVHRLFDIFDTDGNGTVDYAELTAGLSLFGGKQEDKVRAAFALYDYNHDGVISLDEMIRYLTAVFKVLFATNPALVPQMQVTPLELAQVTAEQAFLECDINQDGKLTLDEFHAWYTQSNKPIKSSALSIPLPSLAQVHHFTDLGICSPADVIERFRQFATANQLTRAAFSIGLQSFAKPAHKEAVDAIASHVFDLFDTDGNGVVDFVELGAGLCVLCGAGITPEELGTITADQAFIQAEKESDGVLSLDEFRRWYHSTASQNIHLPSLQRVKQVTNLHKFSPSQVFAHLTTHVTDPRGLDRRAFDASFATLRQLTCATTITTDIVDDQMCDVVLDRLFGVFDANGFVSFRQLASGLSILCGGSPTDKIQAVFDLYDANCVISLDEMTAYLTSVYKILCETDMYPKHVTPSELAEMFQRFCHDRSADADNVPADVRFFDASIYQKLNRSMTLGKKYDVSFLEDKAESIRETYVAPPPSTMGLPDNGMRYKYRGFPRLKRYDYYN